MKKVSIWLLFLLSLTEAIVQPMVVLQHIRQQIQARPDLVTNGMVGGILFGSSDMLAQWIEHRKKSPVGQEKGKKGSIISKVNHFDVRRCSSAGILGACLSCGLYPAGYGAIDRLWKKQDLVSLVQKSVVEIFTVGLCANSISMLVRGMIPPKGQSKPSRSLIQVLTHIKDELPEITKHDFSLWFPYNMAAFGLVPPHVRPITTALVDAVWQTYMSLRSNPTTSEHHLLAQK